MMQLPNTSIHLVSRFLIVNYNVKSGRLLSEIVFLVASYI